jgi:hypothetical protein
MNTDPTEQLRRDRIAQLNNQLTDAQQHELDVCREMENRYGKVWDTEGLRQDFEVLGFMAPFVVVREKATGKKGSLEFLHSPRMYFNWQEDR